MTVTLDAYADLLAAKAQVADEVGVPTVNPDDLNPRLKPHQRDMVLWAVRGGRRAIFASFGLGKTMVQLETVRLTMLHAGPTARGLIVLDLLVLWRRLERETGSRRLSQLAERHGITFPAHDATADALATLRLLHILADRHDFLPHISLPSLYRLQEGWYAHQVDAAYQARLGRGDVAEPPSTEWPMRAFAGGDT